MYRIARSAMLVFVRLAIMVSLAGYTMPSANAAMHGSAFPEIQKTMSDVTSPGGDHHMEHASADDHRHGSASSDDGGTAKLVKKECCKDFCGGFAIMCDGPRLGGPVVSSIREFMNDQHSFGELPSLQRPPTI
ncbi:hypothetical protein G6M87_23170 [Rhizobium rhizogenes]|uniref:hypothetical protein n=1 Tax=Rhizobium rhizogenes TaxID=359 RepID=UPI000DDEEB11|nr:hypothetical protein [Rhizobium rhizogenes]NTH14552.1 hypothetical protein [Rhizobium rhizogenes]NTI24695.1 hypothetical protein [Rhizobium rhizogenes]QTG09972.1 hypothetical protein G6M87_23170 [Rhizobium rhizogenes]